MIKRIIACVLCLALFAAPALAQGSAVVAEIGGVQITRAELDAAYEASYGDYAEGDAQMEFDLRHELVCRMLEETAEKLMQEKLGFDSPSQQEIDEATEQAEAAYDVVVASFAAMLDDGSMQQQELYELTEAYLASIDMSREDYVQQAISALSAQKLRAWALEDVAVDEEQLLSAYESMLKDEQAFYSAFPDNFLSCANFGIPYLYAPEGVRVVRRIVVLFDEDQRTEYAFLADAQAQGVDVSADLDSLYAQLDSRLTEIFHQLESGKAFADVALEYSDEWLSAETDGMNGDLYVCQGTQLYEAEFTEAAMALEAPGAVSGPVRMSDGVHILFYAADLPAGAVDFEAVRDYVEESAVYQAETDAYAKAIDSWLEEFDAQIYLEELE